MHPNSEALFDKYAVPFFKDGANVLELGPGEIPSPYQQKIKNYASWYYLDVEPRQGINYVATDPYVFPITDLNFFDIVLSGQVIEHVAKIWRWMPELARVCKPGGHVITINPVSWVFHPCPLDCWRIFPDGMKALYDDAGLIVDLSICETITPESNDTVTVGHKPL